ncbi:Eco57I restriction-modification methylase domain-containing protein [Rathayibacter iranicus]|uniref:site-specific DNA-methyltransferase (adenine-specific) n=1 Tax=Rathayibacter iranicus NCPPB 2253 = VKM Ac-1602 TaxID=1328868 RepID=A0ABX5LC90_9MICO|nr:N-6 DNA methylase [Rathayibacter iranicus]PWJ62498.1 N-6 DNA methylase [Rathayibacter iranicus] [Rathayibacter iranicus NCPPB 2253 = VKM Ac-1602]
MTWSARNPLDNATLRKARGAFFTPPTIASFVAKWAVRSAQDAVLEPSAGDAEFLVHAVARLRDLGAVEPHVHGVELHQWSADVGAERVADAGGSVDMTVGDFFDTPAAARYSAVIGNPPYIRFQDFAGDSRAKARAAALRGGVALSGLASSWAAFTVHGALSLQPGGRLGYVLPAELLHANYAAPVRQFLFENFSSVDLVLFEERVFAEAETESLLLLADGYGGSTDHARVRQVNNADALTPDMPAAATWTPTDPSAKWSGSTVSPEAAGIYAKLILGGTFTALKTWGETTLGMVTGNNKYFALSPDRVAELGLLPREVLRLSPPGSSHLRGLEFSARAHADLGRAGKRTMLFRPSGDPSDAARAYIAQGEADAVHTAYKCRVRKDWWRVPLVAKADMLLTYMNADTPRLTTNSADALHLNSVHGVYLSAEHKKLGCEVLPVAALNSVTMLGAEFTGRAYGGGMLKMEPGEADLWALPSPAVVEAAREELLAIRPQVSGKLSTGNVVDAADLVDNVLLIGALGIKRSDVADIRAARAALAGRREARSRRGNG